MLTALSKIDSGIIGQTPDATAGRNDNPLWQKMCHGRITASNFYRVYTKVQSMKKEFLTSLINPTSSLKTFCGEGTSKSGPNLYKFTI